MSITDDTRNESLRNRALRIVGSAPQVAQVVATIAVADAINSLNETMKASDTAVDNATDPTELPAKGDRFEATWNGVYCLITDDKGVAIATAPTRAYGSIIVAALEAWEVDA